ncbi:hypothetical protein IMZ11_02355 [Microtetraspora sp. AC03309]|uniref:hypothetical protein n=1 Tax=Microtetraspora sp. AC03309 TaxID=2779376 RepID=UPI001E5707B3|nr:hypothetical protein [Microtetraspora sp. AC03309]MCC5574483.1 hypothetical protein [Microtetraspora sp. AC03309]
MIEFDLPVHPRTGLRAIGLLRNGAPIWPVLGGSGEGDVIVQDADPVPASAVDDEPEAQGSTGEPDQEPDEDTDEPLGSAGLQALQREKERRRVLARDRRQAVRERDEALAELARLRQAAEKPNGKDGDGEEAGPDLDAIRKEEAEKAKAAVKAEVLKDRVSDKIEVLAAKRFQDADVVRTLLMASSEIEDFLDGDKIDAEAIKEALDELLEKRPYLGVEAQSPRRFKGSGDGGARKGPTGPSQLTENDLKRMSPEEIVQAQQEGRFNDLLGTSR